MQIPLASRHFPKSGQPGGLSKLAEYILWLKVCVLGGWGSSHSLPSLRLEFLANESVAQFTKWSEMGSRPTEAARQAQPTASSDLSRDSGLLGQ